MQTPYQSDMTLHELLSHETALFGDYLLLSFVPYGDKTKIKLTSTTGPAPVTYSVLVTDNGEFDVKNLRFNANF